MIFLIPVGFALGYIFAPIIVDYIDHYKAERKFKRAVVANKHENKVTCHHCLYGINFETMKNFLQYEDEDNQGNFAYGISTCPNCKIDYAVGINNKDLSFKMI